MAMTPEIEKQLIKLAETMPYSILTVKDVYYNVGSLEKTKEILFNALKYNVDPAELIWRYKKIDVDLSSRIIKKCFIDKLKKIHRAWNVKIFYISIKKKENCIFSRRYEHRGKIFFEYSVLLRIFGREII